MCTSGEKSTSAEIAALAALAALAASGTGEFIRKTSTTTFENAVPASGVNSISIATPTGTVDGVNTIFTSASRPLYLIVDGGHKIEGIHYTYTGTRIDITDGASPTQFIRAIVST